MVTVGVVWGSLTCRVLSSGWFGYGDVVGESSKGWVKFILVPCDISTQSSVCDSQGQLYVLVKVVSVAGVGVNISFRRVYVQSCVVLG